MVKFYITSWFRNRKGKKEQGRILQVHNNNFEEKANKIKRELEMKIK